MQFYAQKKKKQGKKGSRVSQTKTYSYTRAHSATPLQCAYPRLSGLSNQCQLLAALMYQGSGEKQQILIANSAFHLSIKPPHITWHVHHIFNMDFIYIHYYTYYGQTSLGHLPSMTMWSVILNAIYQLWYWRTCCTEAQSQSDILSHCSLHVLDFIRHPLNDQSERKDRETASWSGNWLPKLGFEPQGHG